jgi:Fe-S-cluster containining protein
MNVNFACAKCGQCCHDLKVPLTVCEAIHWLIDGHKVCILVDAVPWPDEPELRDEVALHRRNMSFTVVTGGLASRVSVTLAATFDGACPHLSSGMRCTNYAQRPLSCRIYPAEPHPLVKLMPTSKKCPPEAWGEYHPAMMRGGCLADGELLALIQQERAALVADVPIKARLCSLLGLGAAALINEGFAVYVPTSGELLAALRLAVAEAPAVSPQIDWRYVTDQTRTQTVLRAAGATCVQADAWMSGHGFEYLGLRPA